jgi:hypothetical protein
MVRVQSINYIIMILKYFYSFLQKFLRNLVFHQDLQLVKIQSIYIKIMNMFN